MNSTLYLRIASVLTLIHSVLHTIGGVFGKAGPGPASVAFAAMQSNKFVAMGAMRSFADYYRGLGLGITIFLTVEAIVFWQLGTLAKTHAIQLRPILATFLVAYLALAVNSFFYFFFGPVVAEILIVLCLGLAIVTARSTSSAPIPVTA